MVDQNFSAQDSEKNVSSLVELKRKSFQLRFGKVYNREEFLKNNRTIKREIARLKTALNR